MELTTKEVGDLCQKVIPPNQFQFTLKLLKDEEGSYYLNKLFEIAKTTKSITTNEELVNKDGTHNLGLHYFLGNTDIYISQIYEDGTTFGYTILNGDIQMSEWGYSSLEEITKASRFIELDYNTKEKTIEEALYKKYPDFFENPQKKIKKTKSSKSSEKDITRER